MPLYPKSFIDRLRNEIPISQIIGARVPLKKKGREYEACCPFHQEKTPSFTVNDSKGFYHCFGCSAHGDGLKFLMEHDRFTYPQAIEYLAREAGIPLPEISPEMERRERQRQSLEQVVSHAQDWFVEQLSRSHGEPAREYLARRGLSAEVIELFGIGYAPADRHGLKQFLASKGVEESQMFEAGLIVRPDDGRPSYDKFRERVMFPIRNSGGEVVAFGGRILVKSDYAPKYLNSPETPLFHKGHILYHLQAARQAYRDDVTTPLIVAEGYMDVIALHRFGFPAAVAPLGTALTEHHLAMLWQLCDNPVLCLDGDAAGQRAMWRSAELALPKLQPGKTLRFLRLPQGKDPDDFLQESGAEALRGLIAQAAPLSQAVFETVMAQHPSQQPETQAAADVALDKLCLQIENASVQHHFRQYFRQRRYEMRSKGRSKGAGGSKAWKKGGKDAMPAASANTGIPATPSRDEGLIRAQSQLLALLYQHRALLENDTILSALESFHPADEALAGYQQQLLMHDTQDETVALPMPARLQQAAMQVTSETDALNHWHALIRGMHLAQLEADIANCVQQLDEQGLARLQALQAEKQQLLSSQYD